MDKKYNDLMQAYKNNGWSEIGKDAGIIEKEIEGWNSTIYFKERPASNENGLEIYISSEILKGEIDEIIKNSEDYFSENNHELNKIFHHFEEIKETLRAEDWQEQSGKKNDFYKELNKQRYRLILEQRPYLWNDNKGYICDLYANNEELPFAEIDTLRDKDEFMTYLHLFIADHQEENGITPQKTRKKQKREKMLG